MGQWHTVAFCEIPDGGEESYWAIFEDQPAVADNDSVWLDITHSFRYLPMLAYAVLQYLQDVRGITVNGIYYGVQKFWVHKGGQPTVRMSDPVA